MIMLLYYLQPLLVIVFILGIFVECVNIFAMAMASPLAIIEGFKKIELFSKLVWSLVATSQIRLNDIIVPSIVEGGVQPTNHIRENNAKKGHVIFLPILAHLVA